jgi:predicted MFS family arabinose efflux permease
MSGTKPRIFTRYQVFLIAVLAFMQFTVILDFMVMAPLGAMLIPELHITPGQFSHVVLAYAAAAGISGLLAAGFADKYDRKSLLLFFYVGFIIGTLFCGLAPTYELLLAARIFTGIFGGVIGSVSMAIITDVFAPEVRGRVMGFVQMAFAVSQVAGIPIGLFLAHRFHWHAPFLMIVGFGTLAGFVIFRFMRPVADHLKLHPNTDPVQHLLNTFLKRRHTVPFLTMMILATGGFMMMPFSTTFLVNNVGVTEGQLPWVFVIIGLCSMVVFPLMGRLSDRFGKLRIFIIGTAIAMTTTVVYSHLGPTPLWQVIVINAISFVGIGSRIVSSQALITSVPEARDRGAFSAITASIQQLSGAIAAGVAGLIVIQANETAPLQHYDTLGIVCACTMFICVVLMYFVDRQVKRPSPTTHTPAPAVTANA